jgi:hypothetical protein
MVTPGTIEPLPAIEASTSLSKHPRTQLGPSTRRIGSRQRQRQPEPAAKHRDGVPGVLVMTGMIVRRGTGVWRVVRFVLMPWAIMLMLMFHAAIFPAPS